MLNRLETDLLHDPGDDDHLPDADAESLAALRKEFGARWRIWRAVDARRVPGKWCAHRISGKGGLVAASATTADELARTLQGAEQ